MVDARARWVEAVNPHQTEPAATRARAPDGWAVTANMVFEIKAKESGDEYVPICGPLWIVGRTTGPHGAWGMVLVFVDHDGGEQRLAIPAARLHEDSSILSRELATLGLKTIPGKEKRLLAYLASWDVRDRILSAKRLGWVEDKTGGLAYVMPDRVISRSGARDVVFQPERYSPTVRTVHESGSLETWREQVAAVARKHPTMLFALCAGFAPAVMAFGPSGDSFVVHLWGTTSRGKTTLAQIAASVWGCAADPNDAPSLTFIRRWNLTGNGLEGLAEAHSDMPLVLDELGAATVGDIRPLVYQLAGGQGKSAMNSSREMKEPRSWRTIAISTGEMSIHARMSDPDGDGTRHRAVKGGLIHRALDVEVSDIAAPSPVGNRGQIVEGLKAACARQYGTAGPELIKDMVMRFSAASELRAWLKEKTVEILTEIAPAGLPSETRRAAERFALIAAAGELASDAGIIPATAQEIRTTTRDRMSAWLAESSDTDDQRIVESVRGFILKHASRFQATADETPSNRAGWLGAVDGNPLWLFSDDALTEAAPGNDRSSIARALRSHGLLFTNEAGKLKARVKVPGCGESSRPWLYAVRESILGEPGQQPQGLGHAADPEVEAF